jgi:alanyl-tRNA synthetase
MLPLLPGPICSTSRLGRFGPIEAGEPPPLVNLAASPEDPIPLDSNQIRTIFNTFFEEKGHVVRPSASLIPNDPTLLLTNAGMVPFKPFFLGEETPPYARATTVQKVVRTIDIDIIGTTLRHLSFFEMLGNFSFGDYFKADAIPWSYELVTERFGLDPDLLWFSVFETDDEAFDIWAEIVPPERIQRRDEKDNFWQMGIPGPCGPCSELFFDKGPEYGEGGGPAFGDEDRFVEIWNLVFMQNIQDEPYHVIGDLPAKNIDTGMGLERMAAVLQGVRSVFDIDTLAHVRDAGARYTGLTYGEDERHDISLRILADHGRAVTFLIGDGVIPSNDGRGYVLRRILRRAVRHAWQYGGEGLIFPGLVEATVESHGDWYTELVERHDFITDVVTREEERFRRTLESGHQLLDVELQNDDSAELSGATVFKLHDTYGFPVELTTEIAAERGVTIDTAGFEAEMAEQRSRARAAWKGGDEVAAQDVYRSVLDVTGLTEFVGYETDTAEGQILAMVADGEPIERAEEGRQVELFLSRTPFYAESGGQIGDSGLIETETGSGVVVDTKHALQGLHGHRLRVDSGYLAVGQQARARIDVPRRDSIRRSHTGTHVLHWALRDVLGDHAAQAGSLVEPGRLRFDFSHFAQVAPEELAEVESRANQKLIDNGAVKTTVTTKEKAEEMGALAFFGDKYGDTVRVVQVGDFSVEFCGGTHTHTSAQVGPLLVTSEASIGSNLRRVEALTGMAAYQHLVDVRSGLDRAGRLLKTSGSEVPARVEALLGRVEGLESELEAIRSQRRGELAAELAGQAIEIGDASLLVGSAPGLDGNALRQLALGIRDRLGPASVVVVGSDLSGKGSLVGLVTKSLVEAGISASEIISEAAKELGGGASRDPELAQAGGPNGDRLGDALARARDAAERVLRSL